MPIAPDVASRVALTKLGLDPNKDVSILQVGSETSRIAALENGAIQGGVAQPPARYDLEAQGLHSLYDLAAEHVPSANTAVVFKKSYADAHKDAQKYVDSIVQAIAREKSDETYATKVMGQYLKLDKQDELNRTWEYYVQNIVPSVPATQTNQFTDAVNALSQKNAAVKSFDLNKLIDNEFVDNAKSLASTSPAASGSGNPSGSGAPSSISSSAPSARPAASTATSAGGNAATSARPAASPSHAS